MKSFILKIIIRLNNFVCSFFKVIDERSGETCEQAKKQVLIPPRFFKGKATNYHFNPEYKPAWLTIFENGFLAPPVWFSTFSSCYLIGKGLLLDSKKDIYLESAFFQREYLNKLRVGDLIIKLKLRRPSKKICYVLPLMNRLSNNYFHWTAEHLTRIALLVKYVPNVKEQYVILINHDAPVYVIESLIHLIGWPANKIQRFNSRDVAHVTNCIQISYPVLRDASTSMFYAYPPYIFNTLNEIARQNILPGLANMPSNFIISRANATARNLLNEKAVAEHFSHLQLEIVYLEKLNFTEQIQLFMNARIIIAPHGAGLTNLTYCKETALVIELYPIGRNFNQTSSFHQISKARNIQYFLLMLTPQNIKEDMIADIDVINEIDLIIKRNRLN